MTAERDGKSRRTGQPDLLASLPDERPPASQPAPGIDPAAIEELLTEVRDLREQVAGLKGAESAERPAPVTPEALEASGQEALPAHTQEVVTSWLDYHAGCQSICRQIRDWPARVDALTADCPEPSATLDSLRG